MKSPHLSFPLAVTLTITAIAAFSFGLGAYVSHASVTLNGSGVTASSTSSNFLDLTSSTATLFSVDNQGNVGANEFYGDTGSATPTPNLSFTSSGGLNVNAGGTNQNINLNPSGTGNTILGSGSLQFPNSSVQTTAAFSCNAYAAPGTNTIQAAAAALTSGQTLCLGAGTYTITDAGGSINLGNGSTTSLSTQNGVGIVGMNPPGTNFWGFSPSPAATVIDCSQLTGTTNCINLNGVMEGWKLENLFIKGPFATGNPTSGPYGINVVSAKLGSAQNLVIEGFQSAIWSDTLSSCSGGCSGNYDSLNNYWQNISIQPPNNTNATGIRLGGSSAGADTDYNTFIGIGFKNVSATTHQVDLMLQDADSNTLINVRCSQAYTCLELDYGTTNQLAGTPTANVFFGLDPADLGGASTVTSNGTTATAPTNYIFGDESANGAPCAQAYGLIAFGCKEQQGVATLASGTVTVATSAACGPSQICVYHLTNCGVSGTPGVLSFGGATFEQSFIINSSNSSDDSKVCWSIN